MKVRMASLALLIAGIPALVHAARIGFEMHGVVLEVFGPVPGGIQVSDEVNFKLAYDAAETFSVFPCATANIYGVNAGGGQLNVSIRGENWTKDLSAAYVVNDNDCLGLQTCQSATGDLLSFASADTIFPAVGALFTDCTPPFELLQSPELPSATGGIDFSRTTTAVGTITLSDEAGILFRIDQVVAVTRETWGQIKALFR